MTQPIVALFGAKGQMGRYLLQPLLGKKSVVHAIDLDSSREDVAEAWRSDIIVLSVPYDVLGKLFDGVKLDPHQLVIDICSTKRDAFTIISQSGASHLSLHPMHGPHTPWTKQKWLIVGSVPDTPHAQWFLSLLREKQVMFHTLSTPEEHDLLMSVVLGLPEFLTVFLSEFFDRLRTQVPGILDTKNLLKVCPPAFASLLKTYIHTICSTRQWLREHLLRDADPAFHKVIREVCAVLSHQDSLDALTAIMNSQIEDIHALDAPEYFVPKVREFITEDFNFMNAVFLGGGLKPHTALYIQKPCERHVILGGKQRVRVGIHGIVGSFTDEAWHRFAAEELHLTPDMFEIVELVHSENVLRAVADEEVDRGIFAFANSGTGGYLASIEAMGRYPYELIALFTMPINMCILAHPSVEHVHELEKFFGHPVALSQCRKTLAQRWPDVSVEYATDEMDTALSAKLLAEGNIHPKWGVFASKRAAAIYGLKIVAEAVHHDPSNATAFAVVKARGR